jgi:hypothetical protein
MTLALFIPWLVYLVLDRSTHVMALTPKPTYHAWHLLLLLLPVLFYFAFTQLGIMHSI